MSFSPAQLQQYTAIIDKIIADGDVDTITVKQVRNGLQAAVGQDLSEYKEEMKALIHERFDKFQDNSAPSPPPQTNGHSAKTSKGTSEPSRSASTPLSSPDPKQEEDEDDEISPPPKKKAKKNPKAVDSDAALAAKLQAQENTRSRSTRGGGAKPVKKRTAAPKKKSKSSKKVGEDDDSDVLGSDGEKKESVKKGGFHKEYLLSEPMADLVGATQLSRPQVVKKIWDHIKAHELQDPGDKRQIRCDDKMVLVFKTDRIHMFTMNKHLGSHLYPVEETE